MSRAGVALHKLICLITSQTRPFAHASSRSSRGGTKTGLERAAEIEPKLGPEICQVLPSLHAMTGCDSVSAFASKGKKKALGIVQLNPVLREFVGSLGEGVPARVEDLDKLEQFVCALYNDHKCNSVNKLRYKVFCKSKNMQSHQLSPTRAALANHLKRANYQTFLWKHALEPHMDQDPDGQGWQLKEGQLEIY